MRKPILCLDFDGVIHSYVSGWKGAEAIVDGPVPGALTFIQNAIEHFEVHIYSSRSNQAGGIDAMKSWLKYWLNKAGVSHSVASDLTHNIINWPTNKPSAFITLDDRAITFTGQWPDLTELKKFKPWNK